MIADTLWIAFDLGVDGDYGRLYAWLDAHKAEECGASVAALTYRYEGSLPDKLREDLKKSIQVDEHTSIYVIYRDPVTRENKGTFLFGGRKVSAWTGYAGSVRDTHEDAGWRRYAWTPPGGTVFQVRATPLDRLLFEN